MVIKVLLLAFNTNKIRLVDIPDVQYRPGMEIEEILELAFYHGQNDWQPMKVRSVSEGDIVILPTGEMWMCQAFGWSSVDEVNEPAVR